MEKSRQVASQIEIATTFRQTKFHNQITLCGPRESADSREENSILINLLLSFASVAMATAHPILWPLPWILIAILALVTMPSHGCLEVGRTGCLIFTLFAGRC